MKLTKGVFLSHWERLARRFNRNLDASCLEEANDYYAFLSERISAEDFLLSATAVWATSKWFPRPADFLSYNAGMEWLVVLSLADKWDKETWNGLTNAAKVATESIGGLNSIGGSRDIVKIRNAWFESFERAIQTWASSTDGQLLEPPSINLSEKLPGFLERPNLQLRYATKHPANK